MSPTKIKDFCSTDTQMLLIATAVMRLVRIILEQFLEQSKSNFGAAKKSLRSVSAHFFFNHITANIMFMCRPVLLKGNFAFSLMSNLLSASMAQQEQFSQTRTSCLVACRSTGHGNKMTDVGQHKLPWMVILGRKFHWNNVRNSDRPNFCRIESSARNLGIRQSQTFAELF